MDRAMNLPRIPIPHRTVLALTFATFVASLPLPAQESPGAEPVRPAAAATGASSAPAGGHRTALRPRNRITAEEIAEARYANAYQLVEGLRPGWLRIRGRNSISRTEFVRVYVDGTPRGGVGVLRQIPVTSLRAVEHLTGAEATQRFGTDHGAGAILITSR
jgi:hypothetical protein